MSQLEEFMNEMLAKTPRQPFKPYMSYNRCGDLMNIMFEEEFGVHEWIRPGLLLVKSNDEDKRIIGVTIEGVSRLLHDDTMFMNKSEDHEERYEVPCPHCSAPLFDGGSSPWDGARCPQCKERVDWDINSRQWVKGEAEQTNS